MCKLTQATSLDFPCLIHLIRCREDGCVGSCFDVNDELITCLAAAECEQSRKAEK